MHFLPSRGRPLSLNRFFMHYELTEGASEGVVWLDDDDEELKAYERVLDRLPEKWMAIIRPRCNSLGDTINAFFKMFPDEPWYSLLADDLVPRTKHWDRKLIYAAGKDGLAYGDDMLNNERHASHPVVGGDRIRELGWLSLPGCRRTYIDNALMEDAKRRGKITYLSNVITEHLHFSNGKSPMDETYAKPHSHDKEIFDTWLASLT